MLKYVLINLVSDFLDVYVLVYGISYLRVVSCLVILVKYINFSYSVSTLKRTIYFMLI